MHYESRRGQYVVVEQHIEQVLTGTIKIEPRERVYTNFFILHYPSVGVV